MDRRGFLRLLGVGAAGAVVKVIGAEAARIDEPLPELVQCGRCGAAITEDEAECCWYCTDWLCFECWDCYGECGHPEAEKYNRPALHILEPRWDDKSGTLYISGVFCPPLDEQLEVITAEWNGEAWDKLHSGD